MEYFEMRERAILGEAFDEKYNYCERVYKGITCNKLKCEAGKIADIFEAVPSKFCEDAFVILDEQAKLGRHPYHHAGAYYVQEPSAAAPAGLLDIQPGDRVLDICAAPGGKTQQLAAKLCGKGIIVANEFVFSRAQILRSNLERMGVKNSIITSCDTKLLKTNFGGFFNKILVDAPCSGEGMFRKEAQASKQHSEILVNACAELSAGILQNAADCLAKGGKLLLSTCTFSSQENEMQVCRFLENNPDFSLVECNTPFGSIGEQCRAQNERIDVSKARRIYPCDGGEGHFMAVFTKNGIDHQTQLYNVKESVLPAQYKDFVLQYFPSLINAKIQNNNGKIIILPQDGMPKIGALGVLAYGVAAGQIINSRFEPSHALFMAFWQDCINTENLARDDNRVNAWLRGEEISAITAQKGYCAVTVDDMPLGFGKISATTCKNHYPKGLRNLN